MRAGDKASSSNIDSNGKTLSNQQVKYFSESLLRDLNGNLLQLYHGSRYGKTLEFDMYNGIWVTTSRNYAVKFTYGDNLNVYKVYALGKNILDIGETNYDYTDTDLQKLADKLGVEDDVLLGIAEKVSFDANPDKMYSIIRSHEFIELAKELGYDTIHTVEDGADAY